MSHQHRCAAATELGRDFHMASTSMCEIIVPLVRWVISAPNSIFQVPPDSTSHSLAVHAVVNDTREADGSKSASIPKARLSKKFRMLATPPIDLCIVVGTRYHVLPGASVMLFVLLVCNFSSNELSNICSFTQQAPPNL